MKRNELKYALALTQIPGIGCMLAKNLLSYCGSFEAVFKAKKRQLLTIPGIGEKAADAVSAGILTEEAETEFKFIEQNNITPLFFMDAHYPQRLKNCLDHPLLLFYKGNADLNQSRIIGIIGTRNATPYGRTLCEQLINGLSEYNPLIISGLAYGIDIVGHREALKNNLNTVGVLGHGLDRIYPWQHEKTALQMQEQGGLLTEFRSGSQPDRENFPRRNRIVAGMCDAIIVVETGVRGGSMITAEIANSYHRDVLAFPGRIKDPYSAGCHYLIKNHKAALIESAEDVAYILGWEKGSYLPPKQRKLMLDLTEDEMLMVGYLEKETQAHIDDICHHFPMEMSKAANILLNLEINGIVRSMPGKRYALN